MSQHKLDLCLLAGELRLVRNKLKKRDEQGTHHVISIVSLYNMGVMNVMTHISQKCCSRLQGYYPGQAAFSLSGMPEKLVPF